MLWRHNVCPWRHQQKFIKWLKYQVTVNMILQPKFSNSSIFMREVIIGAIL